LQLFYGGELVYYINVGLTKITLLILYLRLFVTTSYSKLRLLTWVMIGLTTAVTITWTFLIMLQCTPVAKAWETTLPGKCVNMTAVFYSHAGINILLDFIVYIMPIPMLWGVNRPLRDRLALIIIFAIGGFVCIMGIVRLQSLRKATVSTDPSCSSRFSPFLSQNNIRTNSTYFNVQGTMYHLVFGHVWKLMLALSALVYHL
jgi:hypothetical protein